jgi:hypothetical protein
MRETAEELLDELKRGIYEQRGDEDILEMISEYLMLAVGQHGNQQAEKSPPASGAEEAKTPTRKAIRLSPLGDFVARHSATIPPQLWRDIIGQLKFLVDQDADWQVYTHELKTGAQELEESFLELLAKTEAMSNGEADRL